MNPNYNGYNPNYNNPNYNPNYNNQNYEDDSNRGGGCLSFIIALLILIITVSVLLQMVGIVDFKELYNKYINKTETKETPKEEPKPVSMKETLVSVCSSLDTEGKYTNDDKHIACVDKVCTTYDDELTYTYDCTSKEYIEKPVVKKEYLTNITREDLQTKLTNKETFVILISSKKNDSAYQEIITKLLTEYDLSIYSYNIDTLSADEQKTFKETLKAEETPIIMFVNSGIEDVDNRLVGTKTSDEIKAKFKELTLIKEIE